MPRIVFIAVLVASATALADVRAEMTAALIKQADLHPTPVVLPTPPAATHHAVTATATKRAVAPRAVADDSRAAASQLAQQAHGAAQALMQKAQAATTAVAGQARAQAAKDRHPPR